MMRSKLQDQETPRIFQQIKLGGRNRCSHCDPKRGVNQFLYWV